MQYFRTIDGNVEEKILELEKRMMLKYYNVQCSNAIIFLKQEH